MFPMGEKTSAGKSENELTFAGYSLPKAIEMVLMKKFRTDAIPPGTYEVCTDGPPRQIAVRKTLQVLRKTGKDNMVTLLRRHAFTGVRYRMGDRSAPPKDYMEVRAEGLDRDDAVKKLIAAIDFHEWQ